MMFAYACSLREQRIRGNPRDAARLTVQIQRRRHEDYGWKSGIVKQIVPRIRKRSIRSWSVPYRRKRTNSAALLWAKKGNKQWLWLALDAHSRQVLTFHVGGRCPKMIFSSLFSKRTQEEQATRMRDKAGPLRTSDDLSFGIPDLQ